MSDPLSLVKEEVATRMDEILGMFKPGAKISVLVRTPGNPDADFMMTNDALEEAMALLERRKAAGGAT